jgi:hypothetical protein
MFVQLKQNYLEPRLVRNIRVIAEPKELIRILKSRNI